MTGLWAITGGTGFIGRALAARLQADGIPFRILRGDIRDRDALRAFVRGASVVVHLAGYVHRSLKTDADRAECRAVNEGGTAALIDATALEAPDAFVVFISTANVYAPGEAAVDESVEPRPRNEYGTSKLAAERIVLDGRVAATVLRPAMVFGPGGPGNLPRLVSFVRRGVVVLFGRGENRKSLVPVEMLVDAIVAVARERTAGRVFNVAGETFTMRRINEVLAEGLGRKPLVISLPRFLARILGPLGETYASSNVLDDAALRALPSYAPPADVESAIRATARSLAGQ